MFGRPRFEYSGEARVSGVMRVHGRLETANGRTIFVQSTDFEVARTRLSGDLDLVGLTRIGARVRSGPGPTIGSVEPGFGLSGRWFSGAVFSVFEILH